MTFFLLHPLSISIQDFDGSSSNNQSDADDHLDMYALDCLKVMPRISWHILAATGAVIIIIIGIIAFLPVYTIILAIITIIRAKWRHRKNTDAADGRRNPSNNNRSLTPIVATSNSSPWSHIRTSFFQGTVFHIRHRPVVHAFKYPLYFSVVELDEAAELFGSDNVIPISSSILKHHEHMQPSNARGTLWPLSSLMSLRDIDHMKNGEGLVNNACTSSNTASSSTTSETTTKPIVVQNASMRERICNLVHERTNGKLDIRNPVLTNTVNDTPTEDEMNSTSQEVRQQRKIILVTHLMYYGYCFNPVSLFFILKSTNVKNEGGKIEDEQDWGDKYEVQDELEAIVVEVSNTPWNEMSIYVLHPDSVDTLEHTIYPPPSSTSSSTTNEVTTKFNTTTHRYRWRKNFHVSPFMTMDFDYDWKFQVSCDRIKVEATMIRRPAENDGTGQAGGVVEEKVANAPFKANESKNNTISTSDEKSTNNGQLYFTAGFDIHRTILTPPTIMYPLQLARIILRFPIYCFIIQLWIHYEAFKLLMKGVQFIPHPQGRETGASKAIATVMRPIFGAMEVVDVWWSRWKCRRARGEVEKCKDA